MRGKDPASKNSSETAKVPKLGWSRTGDTGKMVLMVTIRHPHYRRTYLYIYEYRAAGQGKAPAAAPIVQTAPVAPPPPIAPAPPKPAVDLKGAVTMGRGAADMAPRSPATPEEVLKAFFDKTMRMELDGYGELFCQTISAGQVRDLTDKREKTLGSGGVDRSASEQFLRGIQTDFSATRFERILSEPAKVRIKVSGSATILFPDKDTRIHRYDETDQYTLVQEGGAWRICPSR